MRTRTSYGRRSSLTGILPRFRREVIMSYQKGFVVGYAAGIVVTSFLFAVFAWL